MSTLSIVESIVDQKYSVQTAQPKLVDDASLSCIESSVFLPLQCYQLLAKVETVYGEFLIVGRHFQ